MSSSEDSKTFAGYQTLNDDVREKLLEGYDDALSSAWDAEMRAVEQATCPRCGECRASAEVIGPNYFRDLTPNWYSRCHSCQTLFNPHTGLVVEEGGVTEAQANPSVHLIYSDSTSNKSRT